MIRLIFENLKRLCQLYRQYLSDYSIAKDFIDNINALISNFDDNLRKLDELDETKINEIYSNLKTSKQNFIKEFNNEFKEKYLFLGDIIKYLEIYERTYDDIDFIIGLINDYFKINI